MPPRPLKKKIPYAIPCIVKPFLPSAAVDRSTRSKDKNVALCGSLLFFKILRRRVADAIFIDGKHAIAFRQARRVVDLANSRLASALLQ